jgi:hypothetical protein
MGLAKHLKYKIILPIPCTPIPIQLTRATGAACATGATRATCATENYYCVC